jgi:UDPglucose 6-dehydrogenase
MFNTVSDKQIAIWGFAFKKDTNDTRESAAIHVCRDLLHERARLVIYDPQVSEEEIRAELRYALKDGMDILSEKYQRLIDSNVRIARDAYQAAEGAHAIAVLTEWDEFKGLDYRRVLDSMHRPAFVFDGRNILNRQPLAALGFEVHGIGKPLPR